MTWTWTSKDNGMTLTECQEPGEKEDEHERKNIDRTLIFREKKEKRKKSNTN